MAYNITSPTASKPITDFYKPITGGGSTGTAAGGSSGGGSGGYYKEKDKKNIPSPISASNLQPQRNNVTYVNGRPAFVNGNPIGQYQNMNLSEANGHIYSTTNTDVNVANINQQNISSGINGEHNTYNNLDPQAQSNVRLATQALDKLENTPLSENFDIDNRQNGSFLSVSQNPDGTYNVKTTGFRWGNDTYGSYELGNVSYNPQTVYDATMPLLNYAANVQGYDSTNQIVQGAMSVGNSLSAISPEFSSIYNDTYVSDFLNATDMAYNWNSRNDMENAISGLNTASGVMSKLDVNGASSAAQTVHNGLALYNFGNSFYHLVTNWDDMTPQQRVGGMIGTTWAASMAYTPMTDIVSNIGTWATNMGASGAGAAAGAGAGAGAVGGAAAKINSINSMHASGQALDNAASAYSAEMGKTTGESLTELTASGVSEEGLGEAAMSQLGEQGGEEAAGSGLGPAVGFGLALAYDAYLLYDLATNGTNLRTNQERSAQGLETSVAAFATYCAAVTTGVTSWSGWWAAAFAAIGFAVGYGVGMVKTGHSWAQRKRDMYKNALVNSSVFDKNSKSQFVMQLADGSFYHLVDGSGNRATDINGNKKTVYDESKIKNRNYEFVNRRDENGNIRAYVNPYDIDYTCDLDFTSSIMGKGLLVLSLGSNYRGTGEIDQMLGYIVNGVTSNAGRDWNKENFTKVTDNLKATYYRSGIGSKQEGVKALIDAYFSGAITESDYRQSIMGLDFIYDDNGFEQASQLMNSMGRTGKDTTQAMNAIEDKQQSIADNGDRLSQETQVMNQMSEEPQVIPEQSNQLDAIDLSMVTPSENAAQGATLDVPAETSVETAVPVEPTTTTVTPTVSDATAQYQQTASTEAPQEPVTETQS